MMDSDHRTTELSNYITTYLQEKKLMQERRENRALFFAYRKKLLELLSASENDWNSWTWQMANRFTQTHSVAEILGLPADQAAEIESAVKLHRMAISPFLLAILASFGAPLAHQFLPNLLEVKYEHLGKLDPMAEEKTSPVPNLTRRYPDRVILNVTNMCGSYCRFCQRRRNLGTKDFHVSLADLEPAFEYIQQHKEVRDVLITGGDPLTLTDKQLLQLLERLRQIPSVEIVRIGTRMPVVIPQRVTQSLAKLARRFAPLYINIHVNHPMEVSPEMEEACRRLVLSGSVLGSQTVLLNGVNDSAYVLRYLFQLLLTIGVRPYYIFHAKDIAGTGHFRTPVAKGVEILESLRGVTSGLAIPNFVVNMPGGLGKVCLKPEANLNSLEDDPILFKTWENKIVPYPNGRSGVDMGDNLD